MSLAAIILAAGKGTRMKSDLPKGLHRVCGVPMLELVARALREAGVERPAIVVGHGGDLIISALGEGYDYAWQHEQNGTGHAALMGIPAIAEGATAVVITPGDTPLLEANVFDELWRVHQANGNACTMAAAILNDPSGYGRVIRSSDGLADRIVEHKDASDAERQVKEVNAGIYCFELSLLKEILPTLGANNVQGEIYLTDAIQKIRERGLRVESVVFEDEAILAGVNDRWQLAQAAKELRLRILKKHAMAGVTIVDPDTTYIEPDVEIGIDCTIEPGTIIEGATRIGPRCHLGPNTKIQDSSVGEGCTVLMSHLNEATMLENARCGPFANLRPGAVLGPGVKIGNFVEVKNAKLGAKTSVSHLSYIGDGEVGANSNIGAGTIFCNYDGYKKSRTEIGDNVFVGSNSTLVAPIKIGDGAMIAAGSVVTHEVPADSAAFGRARQETKEGWAQRWRDKKQSDS